MQWTTPSYTDLRFGFEITMYIANRWSPSVPPALPWSARAASGA